MAVTDGRNLEIEMQCRLIVLARSDDDIGTSFRGSWFGLSSGIWDDDILEKRSFTTGTPRPSFSGLIRLMRAESYEVRGV